VKKFWLKILMLSLMVSMIALRPVSTQENKLESPPELKQASLPEKPSFTPEQEAWISLAFKEVAKDASKAAVDKAVPIAVQAAIAQYSGDLAVQYERNRGLITSKGVFRAIVLSIAFGEAAKIILKNEINNTNAIRSSYAVGGAIGALWLFKDELPYINWTISGELPYSPPR
jgi:hypothetical protein